MIEFGLFSSHLPYIIFIAIYMLYCGASSLNRQDRGEPDLQSEVTKRHFTTDTRYDNKTLIFRITSCIRSVAEKCTDEIGYVPGDALSDLHYCRDNILLLHHFIGNTVFSRPPPFSSWN